MNPETPAAATTEETALRRSQEQLANLIASAMDAIISLDDDLRVVLFNEAAEEMFGLPAASVLGRPLDGLLPERFREGHAEHIRQFGASQVTRRRRGSLGKICGLHADGTEFPAEASISRIGAGGDRLYTVILRDITKRVRAEEQLREQADLLDHARDAILVLDVGGRILFWNRGAEEIYGWAAGEVRGRDVRMLFGLAHAQEIETARQSLLATGEWSGELRQATQDGREIIVSSHLTLVRGAEGQVKSILAINTDVTARKKLESQFLRAQRMESIGTLAGGIAHDLNNILSPILMAAQLLQARLPDPNVQRLLGLIQESAERGSGMVKQVLTFARGIEGERIALHPKHIVRETVKILRETLPRSIEVRFRADDEVWPVRGDATQLFQVLMNLSVNARDAMPEGGLLRIEAENVRLDENYARMNLEAKPGLYVLLSVTDTGVGIPPENLGKIFEPFFTTKGPGTGTGLGLSTVVGIVKSHGGFVDVYSEPGRGTQFKVYLPALAEAVEPAVAPAPELPAGKGELILVVDDEAPIREVTRETLESYGYRVLTAADGTEAVALFAAHADEVAAVLTDMMMPYMDGPATIRALRKLRPGVKLIASSGLSGDAKLAEATQAGARIVLNKPYTAEKLLKALAELLRGA